jgi:DNA-binding transcriptional LysR family regulator
MDRLDEIRAFAAVAEARSFTQGARRLGVSSAQASKLVARLEDRLGARLLNRTTRDVSLTDTGRAYLERAKQLLEDFEALQGSVRDQDGCPRGTLKISAPVSFGAHQLTPALLDFACAFPDLALDSSLVMRKLAEVRLVTCASPAYLEKHGAPETLADLAGHEAVIDTNGPDPTIWRFGPPSERQEVRVHGRLRFAGAEACVAAARAGFGITRTPAFAAAEDLRAGRLKALLCGFESEMIHVHVVYPHARHLAPKVRVFVDFLAKRYAGEPEWHRGWR